MSKFKWTSLVHSTSVPECVVFIVDTRTADDSKVTCHACLDEMAMQVEARLQRRACKCARPLPEHLMNLGPRDSEGQLQCLNCGYILEST